jgi:hypothetical protein
MKRLACRRSASVISDLNVFHLLDAVVADRDQRHLLCRARSSGEKPS